jgi:hypothetical protein
VERYAIVGLACLAVLSAIAFLFKAVFFTPALLKSERYVLFDRVIDLLGDPDLAPEARQKLQTGVIKGLSDQWLEKPVRGAATGRPKADKEGEES